MRTITIKDIPVNRELHTFPQVVIFEIVAGCNLQCIICPSKKMTRPKGVMEFNLYKHLIDEIKENNKNIELWTPLMGEVFLYKDIIFKYINYAKQAGLKKVFLNTNFILFDTNWIKQLDESGLDRLIISVDAATEEVYKKIRVGGNFNKLESNIHSLLEAKSKGKLQNLEIVLQFIVQDENQHEEEFFKKKWSGKGLTLKIRQKLGWGLSIHAENLNIPDKERNVPCPWLMRTMTIHWTGQVAQCDAAWNGDFYMGDVTKQTIKEVWLDKLLKRREKHLRNEFDFYPCNKCKDWQCARADIYKN